MEVAGRTGRRRKITKFNFLNAYFIVEKSIYKLLFIVLMFHTSAHFKIN